MTPNLTSTKLRDPKVMLETLRMVYQFACDTTRAPFSRERRRLTDAKERTLGRRLAAYWTLKP